MTGNRNPVGYYSMKPGTRVRLELGTSGYPLREGLKEGDEAVIVMFQGNGFYTVEKGGAFFRIFTVNIGSHFDATKCEWIDGNNAEKPANIYEPLYALILNSKNQPEIDTYDTALKTGFVGSREAWAEACKTFD